MFVRNRNVLPAESLWLFCITLQQPLLDTVLPCEFVRLFSQFQVSYDFAVIEEMKRGKKFGV